MSVDERTRLFKDVRSRSVEEVLDVIVPAALEAHGDLAARGARYREAPALGFEVGDTRFALRVQGRRLAVETGLDKAAVVVADLTIINPSAIRRPGSAPTLPPPACHSAASALPRPRMPALPRATRAPVA